MRFVKAWHSAKYALIAIMEQIKTSLDKNSFTCGVFLDFEKAFDTVNHKILLSKLNYYGVRGIHYKLFHSYLNNRAQYTSIKDINSSVLTLTHVVPQRSVLGPLLFLIYTNDLYICDKALINATLCWWHKSTIFKFFIKVNKFINHDLKLIVHWLQANRISLLIKLALFFFNLKIKKSSKS